MSEKGRIVMIVYNKIQYDARVIKSAEALSAAGYFITVISFSGDSQYKNNAFESIVCPSKQAKPQKKDLLHFALFAFKAILKRTDRNDIVYIHDYYLCILGLILSVFYNRIWVYDAHEIMLYRKTERPSLRTKFFVFLERISIKTASLVVSANYERERIVRKVYKLKNTINVLNVAYPQKNNSVGENIILYQGSLSKERSLHFFIKGLKYVDEKYSLIIVGEGPEEKCYKELVRRYSLNHRVQFEGMIDNSKLLEFCSKAKIGLLSYPMTDLNNYYCSPNKIFEYASIKLPMIMSSQPFLKGICEKYSIGECIGMNSEEEFKEAVEKILNNYSFYTKNMDRFLADFSVDKELEKLTDAINNL